MFKKSSHQGKGAPKGGAPKGGGACGGEPDLPKALKNRTKYGRRRRHSAPTLKYCRKYGPPKSRERFLQDLKIFRCRYPQLADDLEKNQKEKDEEEENIRIPEKEAEKLPELTVSKINFHVQGRKEGQKKIPGNAVVHHTDQYFRCKGKNPQPVFRRGQEFKVTIKFNRPYNVADDDLILHVEADEDNNPGKGSLSTNFKLDEGRTKPFTEGQHWAARIKKKLPEKNALKLAIYIPGNCVVAEWDLKVQTSLRGQVMKLIYEHDVPFVVLFNPWSKQDQVYYTGDQKDLKEYVENDEGVAYYGTCRTIGYKLWTYGQFDEGILDISLAIMRQAFNKMTSAMADPVKVSRALTKIVNSIGDDGVLVGNWSGDYAGGKSPTSWSSSANILKQYMEKGEPVKFGQCWVFSHVLTAVCRALGLPCRSVTNFESAHDTDGSCTIDNYRDLDGSDLGWMNSDSCWNFHVWNDVWMARPEIPDHDCNGWQTIDATPQEQSDGVYQCGPCPLKAVKNGLVHVLYDTAFVFSEVNADKVDWLRMDDGEFVCTYLNKTNVGKKMSTKPPDGLPCPGLGDPSYRYDVTDQYKYPEGSEEDRQAVKRAVRSTEQRGDIFAESANLAVDFDEDPQTKVGENMIVMALVKNLSQEVRKVDMLMAARSSTYYNNPDQDEELLKEKLPSITIKPGETAKVPVTVPAGKYATKEKTTLSVYVYVRCTDQTTKMPYTAQQPFDVVVPDLSAKCPSTCKAGQVVTVTAEFVNPLNYPLTECQVLMDGKMLKAEDDPNKFECCYGSYYAPYRDIKPKEKVSLKFRLYWEEDEEECEDDEDSEDGDEAGEGETPPPPAPQKPTKTQKVEFYCRELQSVRTAVTVTCDRQHHH